MTIERCALNESNGLSREDASAKLLSDSHNSTSHESLASYAEVGGFIGMVGAFPAIGLISLECYMDGLGMTRFAAGCTATGALIGLSLYEADKIL